MREPPRNRTGGNSDIDVSFARFREIRIGINRETIQKKKWQRPDHAQQRPAVVSYNRHVCAKENSRRHYQSSLDPCQRWPWGINLFSLSAQTQQMPFSAESRAKRLLLYPSPVALDV